MRFNRCVGLILLFLAQAYGDTDVSQITQVSIEVKDLKLFRERMEKLDRRDLVLFDVDETLLVPRDQIFWANQRDLINRLIERTQFDRDNLLRNVFARGDAILIDESTPDLVQELQKREIPVIALTAMPYGRADWRIDQLSKLGFDFNLAFPTVDAFAFPKKFREMLFSTSPGFKAGILFSWPRSKGEVLAEFLRRIGWVPRTVVFIDDRLDYLHSVEEKMKEMGIEFFGFHYRGAAHLPHEPEGEKIAEFQLRHLAQHGQWLSDREAKESLP